MVQLPRWRRGRLSGRIFPRHWRLSEPPAPRLEAHGVDAACAVHAPVAARARPPAARAGGVCSAAPPLPGRPAECTGGDSADRDPDARDDPRWHCRLDSDGDGQAAPGPAAGAGRRGGHGGGGPGGRYVPRWHEAAHGAPVSRSSPTRTRTHTGKPRLFLPARIPNAKPCPLLLAPCPTHGFRPDAPCTAGP